MKKIIGLIVILLIVAILAIWMFKAPIASMYLSKKLKLPVSIGAIDTSKTQLKVDKFKIKNPKGFEKKVAFSSDNITVDYKLGALKDQPLVIDRVEMKDNYISIECKNAICSKNNWSVILDNIAQDEKDNKEKKEIIISEFVVNNLDVDILGLGLIPGAKKDVHIDSLTFSNVSSKDGFPTQEIIAAIFKNANLFDYVKDVFDKTKIFEKFYSPINPFGMNETEDKPSEIEEN